MFTVHYCFFLPGPQYLMRLFIVLLMSTPLWCTTVPQSCLSTTPWLVCPQHWRGTQVVNYHYVSCDRRDLKLNGKTILSRFKTPLESVNPRKPRRQSVTFKLCFWLETNCKCNTSETSAQCPCRANESQSEEQSTELGSRPDSLYLQVALMPMYLQSNNCSNNIVDGPGFK